jgi:hypothetical protein
MDFYHKEELVEVKNRGGNPKDISFSAHNLLAFFGGTFR